MFICIECGTIYESIPYITENLGGGYIEERIQCPHCHGSEIEEASECSICYTHIGETQAKFNLCPECETKAEKRFKRLLSENFTASEIEFLNNQYDGEFFGV